MTTGFREILSGLKEPMGDVKSRVVFTDKSGRQHEADYVEWHAVAERLDEVCPEWSSYIKQVEILNETVMVIVGLNINGVTREGIGTGQVSRGDQGIKKAEHDALKRAAVKFGVARELYLKDIVDEEEGSQQQRAYRNYDDRGRGESREGTVASPAPGNSEPVPATNAQLGAVRAIAKGLGLDGGQEAVKMYRKPLDTLSKMQASKLIEYLKGLQ